MGTNIAGFDAYPLEFDRDGNPVDQAQLVNLQAALQALTITDLLVISHGWNNNKAEADGLYQELLTSMRGLITSGVHAWSGRTLCVCTLYWPSKRFTDSDLIPGGVASVGGDDSFLAAQLSQLRSLFDGTDGFHSTPDPDKVLVFDRLQALLPKLEVSEDAQNEFGRLFRSIMPPTANEEEPALPDSFFSTDGAEILNRLSRQVIDTTPAAGGAASTAPGANLGGAAALGNLFGGIKNGAQNFLNLFTYYEMKNRAGIIGAGGVHRALVAIQAAHPALRLHLAGHSFGGRLVTSALASSDGGTIKVNSMSLLQAAFSHFGFSMKYDGKSNGFFRDALLAARLEGPLAVTYSSNDKAVGIAYPLASRLRQQIAASLGDANDPYGGIGRNGALKTPEANAAEFLMLDTPSKYTNLQSGKILNVQSSAYVSSHSDVRNPHVAHLVLSVIEAT